MATIQTGKATELITFSRASNATVTDRDGVIKWAPHNLLLASEQFDVWTKGDATITANAVVAPNGTTTADALLETATTAVHRTSQFLTSITGATYRIGCFVRPLGRDWGLLQIGTGATDAYAFFNITTGVVGTTGTGAINPTISRDATTGWCYISLSVVATGTSAQYLVEPRATDGGTTYLGDITKGIYLWGAHMYRSDLGGMQANTSAYPMYNPTTPKNLLGFTDDYNNASGWSKAGVTVTSNTTLAPNSLQSADTLIASAGASIHRVISSAVTVPSGTPCVHSVYIKAGTYNLVQIHDGASSSYFANFDLNTGTSGNVTGCTATITSAGNGWYRCSIAMTLNAANPILCVGFVTSLSAARNESWTAVGTETVYLWGAQLSDSASLDAYSPNYGAAPTAAAYYGPRLDFDPVTLAAKGLLVEESRTNLLLHSAAFDNAIWSKSGSTATADAVTGPTGTSAADAVYETSATASHQINQAVTTAAGSYTFSVSLKVLGRQWVRLMLYDGTTFRWVFFDIQNGIVGTASGATGAIQAQSNGFYRCAITCTTVVGSGFAYVHSMTADGGSDTFAGDITKGFYAWGAQLEAGSFATSYIPTGAATATRAADVASVSTQAFPYSATEGTLVVTASMFNVAGVYWFASFGITASDSIQYYSSSNTIRTFVRTGGVDQASFTASGSLTNNVVFSFASAFRENDVATVLDGGSATTDTSVLIPDASGTRLSIGCSPSSTGQLNGHIRQITYIPRRLSNTELQARTV